MRIIGIDPGIAIVGFGIIEKRGNRLVPIQYGCLRTKANEREALRLKQIYDAMTELIERYQPDEMAIEKIFFNRNVTTAFSVGQARGVIVLSAEQASIPVYEYTPLEVKQAVVGYGQAEKKQVQEMVKLLLGLSAPPKPDDAADALGIAITRAHSSQIELRMNGAKNE